MTVEAIRLENFMAFRDTGWIELRPITLLFGRNSSGKSVIIRALRLLKQSLGRAPEGPPLAFVVEGGLDLGSFHEAVHGHVPEHDMCFHFRCRVTQTIDGLLRMVNHARARYRQAPIDPGTSDRWLEIQLAYGYRGGDLELTTVILTCPWSVEDGKDLRSLFIAERLPAQLADSGDRWYIAGASLNGHEGGEDPWKGVEVERTSGFLPLLRPTAVDQRRYPESSWECGIISDVLEELDGLIKDFLSGICYLGPLRPEPRRSYVLDQSVLKHWAEQGWGGLIQLLSGDLDEARSSQLNNWLRELDIGDRIDPHGNRYQGELGLASGLLVQEALKLPQINLADSGFGASQVLPVIIAGLVAARGSQLVIEQPELHLHPRAQAQLADLFVETANSGARFLVETHSEHILLRLRRRIAETTAGWIDPETLRTLRPDSLLVLYVDRERGESTMEGIGIGRLGELKSTPGFRGFFADDDAELSRIADAKLEALSAGEAEHDTSS